MYRNWEISLLIFHSYLKFDGDFIFFHHCSQVITAKCCLCENVERTVYDQKMNGRKLYSVQTVIVLSPGRMPRIIRWSPVRLQAITWTSTGLLLNGPGPSFGEIRTQILKFALVKVHLKISAKRRPSCSGYNELKYNFIRSWFRVLKSFVPLKMERYRDYWFCFPRGFFSAP